MGHQLLIVTISPRPEIRLISWPTTRVEIDDESFEETGAGDTNGFYDFLRRVDGHIIGVRFRPFVEHVHICDSVTPGPRLRIAGTFPFKSLEIFWGVEQDFDQAQSGDQFFDWNYVFKSTSEMYAVTFGFSHLPEPEIEDLVSGVGRAETQ
jgi:hypothetical protein